MSMLVDAVVSYVIICLFVETEKNILDLALSSGMSGCMSGCVSGRMSNHMSGHVSGRVSYILYAVLDH